MDNLIERELKYGKWSFNEDTNELTLKVYHPNIKDGADQEITLNKVYMFSLARFMIRVFQRYSVNRRPSVKNKKTKKVDKRVANTGTGQGLFEADTKASIVREVRE